MDFRILVLPGDGIGPEVVQQGVRVLEKVGSRFGHRFELSYDDVGGAAIDKHGVALRASTMEAAGGYDAVLFGAVGGPKWDDPQAKVRPEEGILGIRKGLSVFANLRPVKILPDMVDASVIKPSVLQDVDMLVVRELTGGLYYAKPKGRRQTRQGWTSVDTMRYSQAEIERVLKVGFELARRRKGKLTSVDKANVLETSRLWRQTATDMASQYPDVEMEHMLVDTCAMQIVQRPSRFDVIVTENTFGDILTDEAGILAASMGLLPSASLAGVPADGGRAIGLYEPIHGSAPDIAGQGIANPIATMFSVALLMRYSLGLTEEASVVERAVEDVLGEGYRTADIAEASAGRAIKRVSTEEMGDQVLSAL